MMDLPIDVPAYVQDAAYEEQNVAVGPGSNWDLANWKDSDSFYILPPLQDPSEPVAPEPKAVEPVATKYEVKVAVYFATGSAELTPSAKRAIGKLDRHKRYSLGSHADPRGTSDFNYQLSIRRADAVASYLKAAGFRVDSLDPKGEADPLVSRHDPELFQFDRRVDILVTD